MCYDYDTIAIIGILRSVSSLTITREDSSIFLNWTAPFTLDIIGVDPDITYCVDVVNSTSSATLQAMCGINETEFTYPITFLSACDTILFTVTPVNIVGNGTNHTVSYYDISKYRDTNT